MIEYQASKISEKNFAVTAFVENEIIEFIVGVGESEAELPALVEFHVSNLRIPQSPPAPTYSQLRASEYPPVTDYLDGIVKGDQAQIDKYIADCRVVKAKYPKAQ